MKDKIVYTYTSERLKELKKDGNNKLLSTVAFLDNKNQTNFEISKKYFVDITNLYKSNIDANNMLIETTMNQVFSKENVFIILNDNNKNKFEQDFAASFDEFRPIQTIYKSENQESYDLININKKELKKIENSIRTDLIGHEDFKEDFLKLLKNFPILYKLGEMKILPILISGNPGVGKTEVARILHRTMYKESKMIKINFGNYKTQGALNSLIGSPIGFIGSERGGELSNKIRNSDSKIILIDEFEKADTDIFNFFYELLEDGKFTDLVGNEYDLSGYIIIFTTNLSKDNYKQVLPAPLLSRFQLNFFFESPDYNEKNIFIDKRINELMKLYKNSGLSIKITANKIKQKLDYDQINKISDFRVINRMITNALIKIIDEF